MRQAVACEISGAIALITLDDGERNSLSAQTLAQFHQALEQAERGARAMVITGRADFFSSGLDSRTMARRNPEEIHDMVRLGAELALRAYTARIPVVIACTGHACTIGAVLLLASDYCFAAHGTYRIGLNENSLDQAMPRFAAELARVTLAPHYFDRVMTAELLDPLEAQEVGFVDQVVPARELAAAAREKAAELGELDPDSYRLTKSRIRSAAAATIRRVIDEDVTLDQFRQIAAIAPPHAGDKSSSPRLGGPARLVWKELDCRAIYDKVLEIYNARRRRERFISSRLLGEPGWDILLDLFAARLQGRRISVTSCYLAAGVPQATANRWVGVLEREGLVERFNDRLDLRVRWVQLSDQGFRQMHAYFEDQLARRELDEIARSASPFFGVEMS